MVFRTLMVCIIIALVLIIIARYAARRYHSEYLQKVAYHRQVNVPYTNELLTEADIAGLPQPVQKYIRYSGSINKPKIHQFKVCFAGQIRKNEQSEWMPFSSEQYNFPGSSARLFFMKATMKHLPVAGFHCYEDGKAFMDIRLFSLFKVQYESGPAMDTAETVTFFNDMCCMAPATLIDERIKWTSVSTDCVRASFTHKGISISAWLYFNNTGELINFVSDDRYALVNDTMQRYRWSTPLKDYKNFNGYRLAGYADAVYTYPTGDMCYGQFHTTHISYNGN